MIKTTTEKRADVRIFAGSDPAHTATATSGISAATPALTPLMVDDATGKTGGMGWSESRNGSGGAGSGAYRNRTHADVLQKRYVCH